ncbi:MAG TPA: hypothetical protein VH186_06070 [Chloroflexia bacterium]|nr:hypothetical protein [Chloroflexia bacterium]
MLIACLIAFGLLVAAWVVLPHTAEVTTESKPASVETSTSMRDTIKI